METTTAAAAVAVALAEKWITDFPTAVQQQPYSNSYYWDLLTLDEGFSVLQSLPKHRLSSQVQEATSLIDALNCRALAALLITAPREGTDCLPNWLKVKFKCNQKLEPKNRTRTAFPRFPSSPPPKSECSNQKTTTNLVIRAANDRAKNGREMDWQLMMTMMVVLVLLIIICHTHAHTPTTINKYRVGGRKGRNRKGGGGKGGAGN